MVEEIKAENPILDDKSIIEPEVLDEIVKAGVLYGRKKAKTHPRMRKYIHTTRNGMEIIDVVQTLEFIVKAGDFMKSVIKSGGSILLVGTTPPAKNLVKSLAEKFKFPFITERWLGGTLTNFKTIRERLQYYIKLKEDRDAGRLEKYTKKERLEFDKEIERLTILFGGLEALNKLPQVVLVVGATSHDIAIREAKRTKIPVVAIMSSDADPDLVQYIIPANDRAKSSIAWVLGKLESYLEEGKKEAPLGAVKQNGSK